MMNGIDDDKFNYPSFDDEIDNQIKIRFSYQPDNQCIHQPQYDINIEVLQSNIDDLESKLVAIVSQYYNQFQTKIDQKRGVLSKNDQKSLQAQNDQSSKQNQNYRKVLDFIYNRRNRDENKGLLRNIEYNILDPDSFHIMEEIVKRCKDKMKEEILKYESEQRVKKFVEENQLEGTQYRNIPWHFGGNQGDCIQIENILQTIIEQKNALSLLYLRNQMAPRKYQKLLKLFDQSFSLQDMIELAQDVQKKLWFVFECFQNNCYKQIDLEQQQQVGQGKEQQRKGDELLMNELLMNELLSIDGNGNQLDEDQLLKCFLEQYDVMQQNGIQNGQVEIWYKLCLHFMIQQKYSIMLSILSNVVLGCDFSQYGCLVGYFVFMVQQTIVRLTGCYDCLDDKDQQLMLAEIVKYIIVNQKQEFGDHCFKEIQNLQFIFMTLFIFNYQMIDDEQFMKNLLNYCQRFNFKDQRSRDIQEQKIGKLRVINEMEKKSKEYYKQCNKAIKDGDYSQALFLGNRCLEIRKMTDIVDGIKQKGYYDIIYLLQQISTNLQKYGDAIKYSEQFLTYIEKQEELYKDRKQYLQNMLKINDNLYYLNIETTNYNKMVYYQHQKLKVYKQLQKLEQKALVVDNLLEQTNCYQLIATVYVVLLEYNKAIQNLQEAIKIIRKEQDRDCQERLGLLYHQICLCYERVSHHKKCRKYAKKAFQIREQVNGLNCIDTLYSWLIYCESRRISSMILTSSDLEQYNQLEKAVNQLSDCNEKQFDLMLEVSLGQLKCIYKIGSQDQKCKSGNKILEMVQVKFGKNSSQYNQLNIFVKQMKQQQ